MTATPCVDLALERSFLACVLLDETATHLMLPSDLFAPPNQRVLEAAQAIRDRGETVETASVRIELDRKRQLEVVGGDEYLLAITDEIPAVSLATAMASRLRELAAARRQRERHLRAAAALERGDLEIARRIEAQIANETPETANTITTLGDAILALYDDHRRRAELGEVPGVTAGIEELCDELGPLPPGGFYVIGGGTGSGKSSLMLNMALGMARVSVRPGIVSCEDVARVWAARGAAGLARIDAKRAYHVNLDEYEQARLLEAAEEARKLGVPIAVERNGHIDAVLVAMSRLVREHGAQVLFVDYLQTIRHEGKDRLDAIADSLSRMINTSARLGVPLILGSQLKRPDEAKGEPSIHDLKFSGDIENKADGILLLWRVGDEPKAGESDDRPIWCRVAKCKTGPSRAKLEFTREHTGALRLCSAAPSPQGVLFDEPMPDAP